MAAGKTPIKITKRTVDAAQPAAARYELWDTELKGFGLRVEPSGAKSFIVRYRAGEGGRSAPKRFVSLGRMGISPRKRRAGKPGECLGRPPAARTLHRTET